MPTTKAMYYATDNTDYQVDTAEEKKNCMEQQQH